MNEEEWKPDEGLKRWMSEHFATMAIGAIWMPENTGVTYQKKEGNSLSLIRMVDSEGCRSNHDRMKTVAWDLGYSIIEDEVEIVPEPRNPIEAQMQELDMKRRIAQGWADKDGTLLIDMNIDAVYPRFSQDTEILLDNGETTTVEVWEYPLLNPNTEEVLSIDPDDFHLLMGDDRFMQYVNEKGELYSAMDRGEMIRAIDDGIDARLVGTTDPVTGEKLPPWRYGTYCKVESILGEEE